MTRPAAIDIRFNLEFGNNIANALNNGTRSIDLAIVSLEFLSRDNAMITAGIIIAQLQGDLIEPFTKAFERVFRAKD